VSPTREPTQSLRPKGQCNARTKEEPMPRTILQENVQALLNQEVGVEDDEPIGEWQNVITGSNAQEIPYRLL